MELSNNSAPGNYHGNVLEKEQQTSAEDYFGTWASCWLQPEGAIDVDKGLDYLQYILCVPIEGGHCEKESKTPLLLNKTLSSC